jgi:hypothetical protein
MKITTEMKQLIATKVRQRAERRSEELNVQLSKLTRKVALGREKEAIKVFKSAEYNKLIDKMHEMNEKLDPLVSSSYRFTKPDMKLVDGHLITRYGHQVVDSLSAPSVNVYCGPKNQYPSGVYLRSYECCLQNSNDEELAGVRKVFEDGAREVQEIMDSYVYIVSDASMGSDFEDLKKILKKYKIEL